MATGGGNAGVVADDRVNKLTCPRCLEQYRRPKMRPKILPCFHTLCQCCLQGLAGSSASFPCPYCGTDVLLPPGGVGALQTNHLIEGELASSSPPPPECFCAMCHDEWEATRSGIQCQQQKSPRKFCSRTKFSFRHCAKYMCPISQNRLWVMWYDYVTPVHLQLFDAAGQVLITMERPASCDGLHAITDDIIMAWKWAESTVRLITPDGSVISCDVGMRVGSFVSSATKDIHYMQDLYGALVSVSFILADTGQTDSTESQSSTPHPEPRISLPTESTVSNDTPLKQLTIRKSVVFKKIPRKERLTHVSAGGQYFAFTAVRTVRVYTRDDKTQGPVLACFYQTENDIPINGDPTDAHFCLVDGKELLLVTILWHNKVHIIDHTKGERGELKRYLDTEPVELKTPYCLASDFHQHLWIGCEEGKVVMLDL